MSMEHPLARARGHGSAREGVRHWLQQRVSAALLVFLSIWLMYAVIRLHGAGYEAIRSFLGQPVNAVAAAILVVATMYHAMLGLQVVIEDYVHHPPAELALQFLVRVGALFGSALGLFSLFRIAAGG